MIPVNKEWAYTSATTGDPSSAPGFIQLGYVGNNATAGNDPITISLEVYFYDS